MPIWSITTTLDSTVSTVFHLLRQPNQRLRLTPPEWHLREKGGVEYIELGSLLLYQGRRWGMSQTMEVEIVELEENLLLTEEQRRGPFRRWKHRHRLETNPMGGIWLHEEIDYERPGGVLGQLLSTARIEHDLQELYRWREPVFRELLLTSTDDRNQR